MGKKKRSSPLDNLDFPSSLEEKSCLSGTALLPKEHLMNLDAGIDVGDSSVKLLNSNTSVAHHHYDLGHSVLLKRSRHYYGHHYSRRNSSSLSNPSTSRGSLVLYMMRDYPSSLLNTNPSQDTVQDMVGKKHLALAGQKELGLVHW
ncbi:uncharacterized protein LOC120117551 [Hibiscus syriacus]|uniref:uncharacterized protein LOC120117551 n=1 Tax=Hibiscus syriacus TaxID=106335 RepID=UPI0019244AC6|nr:uncharacterized protein LOC120117551 [Hibiscus syriacus]